VRLDARYHDGLTSRTLPVELEFFGDGTLRVHGESVELEYRLEEIRISERIGNIPRRLDFPNGGSCELTDHAALDSILRRLRKNGSVSGWIHEIESRWHFVLLAIAVTLGFTWGMFQYGIPFMAEQAAAAIPDSVDRALGKGTLKLLDKSFLGTSTLDDATRLRLQGVFKSMTQKLETGDSYRIEFRAGNSIGANAFALPSGIVVVTDELVNLSQNDNEIIAILAHELGHLANRHSLRMVMQDSALLLLLTTISGDAYSTASLATALPAFLLQANYSRDFETEADDYAYDYLVANNIPTHSFADILKRISKNEGTTLADKYLSTHPGTDERIERFK